VFFSQFDRQSVYPFPIGQGNLHRALDAVIADARERGIPCYLTGMTQADCDLVEQLYPGRFRFHDDRDSYDYIYSIDDLADLKGRKFQRKRNHLNRFRDAHPDHRLEPITRDNLPQTAALVEQWYLLRQEENPHGDYQMERTALKKALDHWEELALEGLLLYVEDRPVAMTMGSRLSANTFDIHFEKALDIADGAYAAINNGFARYLREKYPQLRYLNREDDLGLEGLRKAKLSYNPHHMIDKHKAYVMEEIHAL
jgi:hypothetical protein